MADPKTTPEAIAEALRLQEKQALAAKQTVDQLKEQRDIQREIAIAAKATGIPYDHITDNIGHSLREMGLFANLQEKLNVRTQQRQKFENELRSTLLDHNKNTTNLVDKNIKHLAAEKNLKEVTKAHNEAIASGSKAQQRKLERELNAASKKALAAKKEQEIANSIYQTSLNEVREQEKLVDIEQEYIEKLKTQNKLASIASGVLDQMGELGEHIKNKSLNWTDVLKKGVTNFLEYDKVAFSLRKSMGLLRGDFDILQKNVKDLGIELQNLGISFEQVAASTTAIANEFNMFVASSKELVTNVSVMAAQFGIAESDSVKFLKTMSSVAGTTIQAQEGMMGFAKELSNAAGVPMPFVMKDVAEAGDDVRIFTGRSAENLIKGAVQARLMGTTMQNMANTAKKLLDFQTSIADEMEASVLLGKDINFEQARNLAYRKDFVAANQEILRIAKQVNFDGMDPYQAEAFAKASGKSLQELQEMLQADQQIESVRKGTNEQLKAQLEKFDQLKRARKEEIQDVGKIAEANARNKMNQEKVNILSNEFNKLMSKLSKPVTDVIERLSDKLLDIGIEYLPMINEGITNLAPAFGLIWGSFKIAFLFVKDGINILQKMSDFFVKLTLSARPFVRIIGSIGKFGTSVFKIFGSTLQIFGRFLGPVGILINLFTFIGKLMDRWKETPKGIWGGLQAIGLALVDTIIEPFKIAYEWVDKYLLGHSPSKIGLGILEGIKSVGGMLLDALTLPFRTAFNFVSGLFGGPKLPKMSDVVFGGKEETTGGTAKGSDIGTIIAEGNKQVVAKLDELITLMSTGGIAVNIDGSKASMLLARAQKERGAFGAI